MSAPKTLRRRRLAQSGGLILYKILDERNNTVCHHLVRDQAVRVCYAGEDVARQELWIGLGPKWVFADIEVATGYCPVCHEEVSLKQAEPRYPDDPMLQDVHFYTVREHKDGKGTNCEGVGDHPTALSDDGGFGPDSDQWGPPISHGMSHEYD